MLTNRMLKCTYVLLAVQAPDPGQNQPEVMNEAAGGQLEVDLGLTWSCLAPET